MTETTFIIRAGEVDILKFETEQEEKQYKKEFALDEKFVIIARTVTTTDRRI